MIQKINGNNLNVYKRSNKQVSFKSNSTVDNSSSYKDSFVKNVKQTVPMMAGLTALWSVMDNKMRSVPIKTSIKNNFFGFFIPVTVVSSMIIASLENKKQK